MKKKIIIAVVAIVAIAGAACLLLRGGKEKGKVQFEQTRVEQADIKTSVTATGTVEAVTTVDVGTQVSGIVSKLYVDYNSTVKKGQVIAELDRTNLESEVASQQASMRSAQSELDYQKKNYARYAELYRKQLVSASEYDVALESYRKAQEQVKVAAEGVAKARTNLGYATITSPIDGVVISKEVEVGQTVASSFNTPTLFTIAKDLKDMQVVADVDEADIGDVKAGERVTFTVDTYPDDTFQGTVTQVRQEATTTNNVVTYEVVISAPNADLKLKPGLTANVTIFTLEKTGVTNVLSKALRFTPTKETVNGAKIIDCKGKNKVWTKEGNVFRAHAVTLGITDGTRTEILSGVSKGTVVVTDVKAQAVNPEDDDATADSGEKSPFAPGPPGKNKKK